MEELAVCHCDHWRQRAVPGDILITECRAAKLIRGALEVDAKQCAGDTMEEAVVRCDPNTQGICSASAGKRRIIGLEDIADEIGKAARDCL